MSCLHAAALGLVQALGEFLPISSSAHLVLIPKLLGWSYQGLSYDVALHWGTLLAVCVYFRKDWFALARAGLAAPGSPEGRMCWSLVLATVPGGLAGLLCADWVEAHFHSGRLIAATLMGFGLLLWAADRAGRKSRGLADVGWRAALCVGLAQALAVVPGVSRSGVTMTAGLLLGLRRQDAARFSFLLSVPIVVAAGLYELRHVGPEIATGPFWLGIIVTALAGLAAIRFLLEFLKTRGVGVFVAYRLALGLFLLWVWR
ncbi:MAG: undecaprenyl-diphosphate phosphatase [Elusimicrobia bacterium]|nr:undecaprenyl-diphosphate phosphatase [Elusimicrobiota bacterium]